MYRIERPYLAMMSNKCFRNDVIDKCKTHFEKFEEKVPSSARLDATLR
jgi:hypothetical protein